VSKASGDDTSNVFDLPDITDKPEDLICKPREGKVPFCLFHMFPMATKNQDLVTMP
jgi:hypothetical protein